MTQDLERFDEWLHDGNDSAALVLREWLEPIEGKEALVFPPTYPFDDGRGGSKAGYVIDRFDDGTNVCQIDSVGSQANRIEPVFGFPGYRELVPQIVVKATQGSRTRLVPLLEAGHRGADAIIRFSTLGPALYEAFRSYQQGGDAEPLARIAPTSIVFGSWDSRATQAKLPRIVRSVIRAYQVKELHRAAQYSTIAGDILEGGDAEVAIKGVKSELGLAHVPAVGTPGGVSVLGEIRRDAVLKIETLRSLASGSDEITLKLRRYILGLALVSFTLPPKTFLREGCELVLDKARPTEIAIVTFNGSREPFSISHRDALDFATAAAKAFAIVSEYEPGTFDSELANAVQKLNEGQRKQLLRQGPVTKEAILKISKKPKAASSQAEKDRESEA